MQGAPRQGNGESFQRLAVLPPALLLVQQAQGGSFGDSHGSNKSGSIPGEQGSSLCHQEPSPAHAAPHNGGTQGLGFLLLTGTGLIAFIHFISFCSPLNELRLRKFFCFVLSCGNYP